jgi:hypothetical protein
MLKFKRKLAFKLVCKCGTCGHKVGRKRGQCRDPFDCLGASS